MFNRVGSLVSGPSASSSNVGEDISEEALLTAAKIGDLEAVQNLSSLVLCSDIDLRGRAVEAAACNGHLAIVEYLLPPGQTIPWRTRNETILGAASKGYADIVEVLLRNGPIYVSTRDSAYTQAQGVNRDRIRDLLDSAQVVADPTSVTQVLSDERVLTFKAVEAHPQAFLQEFAVDGIPRRVHLSDNPQAVDLGGITKQLITTLIAACCKQQVVKLSDMMPKVDSDDDKTNMHNLGLLFNQLERRNVSRTDKFLVGDLFAPSFYKLVQAIAKDPESEDLLLETAQCMQESDEDMKMAAGALSNPADLIAFQEIMGADSPSEALEAAREYFKPYLQAALSFYEALNASLKAQFRSGNPADLCIKYQGQPCTPEALSGSLSIGYEGERGDLQADQVFMQKVQWLQKKIGTSDLEWRRQFVLAVTGNRSLAPGMRLFIRKGWRANNTFEIHTCFNSFNFSPLEMEEDEFLEHLDYATSKADYNIA